MDCLWHPGIHKTSTCRALEFARHFGYTRPHLSLLPTMAAKKGRLTIVMSILQMGKQRPQ